MRLKIYFGGASPNCGVDVRLNIIQQFTFAHKNSTPFRRGSMSKDTVQPESTLGQEAVQEL